MVSSMLGPAGSVIAILFCSIFLGFLFWVFFILAGNLVVLLVFVFLLAALWAAASLARGGYLFARLRALAALSLGGSI